MIIAVNELLYSLVITLQKKPVIMFYHFQILSNVSILLPTDLWHYMKFFAILKLKKI